MTFDYARSKATAERLIARFGQPATLRQIVNIGTEYAPTQITTNTTITVVDQNQRVRDAAGVLTSETRRTLLVSTAAGVTPAKAGKVQIGGKWHEVAQVSPLSPGGTVIFWEIDLAT